MTLTLVQAWGRAKARLYRSPEAHLVDRDALAQDAVDRQAQVGVLFGAAQGHHRTVVRGQVVLDLEPVHVADFHGVSSLVGGGVAATCVRRRSMAGIRVSWMACGSGT